MGIITLVSHIVARKGYTFLFTGGTDVCKNCRLRKVCIDKLKPGHLYKVKRVLGIKNRCPLNEWVVTVEIEEVPIRVAIPKRYAVEGLTFLYRKLECDSNCKNKEICSPKYLPKKAKVKVVKIYSNIECSNEKEPLLMADVILV